MTVSVQPLIAAVMDLRPGSRVADAFALRQAVAASRHGGIGTPLSVPRWHDEVEYLFHSLRQFGGSLHNAPAEVFYVGSLDTELAGRLAALDVVLKPTRIVDARNPHANKLRMLETDTPYDVLVMLDLDTIILGDFSDDLRTDVIQVMPTEQNWITIEQWASLYDYLHQPLPDERAISPTTGEEIVPYFNTGVILVPRQLAARLHESWLGFIRLLLDRWRDLPAEIHGFRYYIDEISFALAVNSPGLPFLPLPLTMNLPTHIPIADEYLPPPGSTRIAHHYHRLTSQGLMEGCFPELADLVATLNDRVREASAVPVYTEDREPAGVSLGRNGG